MTRSRFPLPCDGHFTAKPGFFLAQIVSDSMNRRVPNGWLNPRDSAFSKADNPKRFHSKGGNVEMRHLTPFTPDPIYCLAIMNFGGTRLTKRVDQDLEPALFV